MENFIIDVIEHHYKEAEARKLFYNSYLLQYLEKKTKSVNKSSKSRGSFASLYAIYVLTEDYVKRGFVDSDADYSSYDGMSFTDAMSRMRELPFGKKLQNHALNDRCNDEFKKFFNKETDEVPIIRNLSTKRYWINEALLAVDLEENTLNIASLCLEIINKYTELKIKNFSDFFTQLAALKKTVKSSPEEAINFISDMLKPNVDARIFEIVSYVIIKYNFIEKSITYSLENGESITQKLEVFKVGRTNANDGGIDYIMQPLGRIFQVTEVLDFKKYFLDIDKLIYYPITFVVKQNISPEEAMERIKSDASTKYSGATLTHYLECFDEIITIPVLVVMLENNIKNGHLEEMIDELITQCKVEYNL